MHRNRYGTFGLLSGAHRTLLLFFPDNTERIGRAGLLTRRRVADGANIAAMVVMALVNLVLLTLSETKVLPLAWSWLVILGTAGTMLLAPALTALAQNRRAGPSAP